MLAGQAQKEGFVNEIAARLDALLFLSVEGEAALPPVDAAEGASWLVEAAPSGAWADRQGQIASRQSGNWLFTQPVQGMRLYNKAAQQEMYFRGTWQVAARPTAPTGGATIDVESRAAISAIIAALVSAGIVSAN
ncbi:DUF2793 domain-containing protein [Novosphingobium sp.]|uniref:DUF2793 domain-containing protein n=1 Tax=Novosphingobium sp. TaxID=1874826 RepID=UPI0035B28DBC